MDEHQLLDTRILSSKRNMLKEKKRVEQERKQKELDATTFELPPAPPSSPEVERHLYPLTYELASKINSLLEQLKKDLGKNLPPEDLLVRNREEFEYLLTFRVMVEENRKEFARTVTETLHKTRAKNKKKFTK